MEVFSSLLRVVVVPAKAEDDFFEVIIVCIQNTNSCFCGVEKKDIGMCRVRRTIERTRDDAHIGFGETTNDDGTKNTRCFRLERTTRGDSDDESSGRGGWVVVSRDVE